MLFYRKFRPNYSYTVATVGELVTAINSASAGQSIYVSAGTYTLTSSLSISKSIKLYGAGSGSTIFQTSGTSADPVNMVTVTSDDVVFKDMTFKHKKSTNSTLETAISIPLSGSGFYKNFIMDSCRVEYAEFGIVIRGENYKLANNTFAYATGTVSNSNRSIGIYGNKGNCFVVNNRFDNTMLSGTATRPIYITSNNANELVTGSLVVKDNSSTGSIQQFFLQDAFVGSANGFDIYILNNTMSETSVFSAFVPATNNAGDIIGKFVLDGNIGTGNHGGTPIGTKGMLTVDTAGATTFRTSNLSTFVGTNTQTNQTYRTGYVAMTQNPASTVPNYLLGRISTISITADVSTIIPTAPTMPITPLP